MAYSSGERLFQDFEGSIDRTVLRRSDHLLQMGIQKIECTHVIDSVQILILFKKKAYMTGFWEPSCKMKSLDETGSSSFSSLGMFRSLMALRGQQISAPFLLLKSLITGR